MIDENDTPKTAFNTAMWVSRAKKYQELGWANNTELLLYIAKVLKLTKSDEVIDAGAGTLAVTTAIANLVKKVYAFDISPEMMAQAGKVPNNVELNSDSISIYENGYSDATADHLVARMVFHHLEKLHEAVVESLRVVGKSVLIVEYVVPDTDCYDFEKAIFEIKEPGRHLWTAETLEQDTTSQLDKSKYEVSTTFKTLEQYSVGNWLGKSGLPAEKQQEMFNLYLTAPAKVRKTMNIQYVQYDDEGNQKYVDPENGVVHDILVDRVFAHLQIQKKLDDSAPVTTS